MSSIQSQTARHRPSANDQMKRAWGVCLWSSMLLAVVLHAATLLYWPEAKVYTAASRSGEAPRAIALAVPGAQNVAPAPPEIVRPELPTVDDPRLEIAENLAVGPLPSFSDPEVETPITPPTFTLRDEWLDYEHFAPFLVAPSIRNQAEMKRFLERHYSPILEFTGAQGVVQVHFWINEDGGVSRAEVAESSGSRSLDRLAMRLSRVLRFTPALRLGQPVRVLVRLPITFRET
jgi:TonB family protein